MAADQITATGRGDKALIASPERFMGMHFMNPALMMQLVDLIRGIATDDATFTAVREVVVNLGKTPTASAWWTASTRP